MKKLILVLMMICSNAVAMGNELHSVVCSLEGEESSETLTIDFNTSKNGIGKIENANFKFELIWRGFYPRNYYDKGPVVGTAELGSQGINGQFDFIHYGQSEHLEIKNSSGAFDNINCTVDKAVQISNESFRTMQMSPASGHEGYCTHEEYKSGCYSYASIDNFYCICP